MKKARRLGRTPAEELAATLLTLGVISVGLGAIIWQGKINDRVSEQMRAGDKGRRV